MVSRLIVTFGYVAGISAVLSAIVAIFTNFSVGLVTYLALNISLDLIFARLFFKIKEKYEALEIENKEHEEWAKENNKEYASLSEEEMKNFKKKGFIILKSGKTIFYKDVKQTWHSKKENS